MTNVTPAKHVSKEDSDQLRALLLRRRMGDAEALLKRRGFDARETERALFEEERHVADVIYIAPLSELLFCVVPLIVAGVFVAIANDNPADERPEPGSWTDYYRFSGDTRTIVILALVAPFLIAGLYFGCRALFHVVRYIQMHRRYPLRRSPDEGFTKF